jgi:hypothetical protein
MLFSFHEYDSIPLREQILDSFIIFSPETFLGNDSIVVFRTKFIFFSTFKN